MDDVGDHQEVLVGLLGGDSYGGSACRRDVRRVYSHVDCISRIAAVDEASKASGISGGHVLVDDMTLSWVRFGKEVEFAKERLAGVVLDELIAGERRVGDTGQQHSKNCDVYHGELN